MPTPPEASEEAKARAGQGRRACWAGRGCAGRPHGQPACLVGWSRPEFPWGEPSVEAMLTVPVPTVWAAREPSARCNTGRETQEHRINTQPRGPGHRSAQPLRKRQQEGNTGLGGERENPHPLGPRTVQLVQPGAVAQLPFPRPQHLCTTSELRCLLGSADPGSRLLSGAGLEFSRGRLFCGTKHYTCWFRSVEKGLTLRDELLQIWVRRRPPEVSPPTHILETHRAS